jgi:hypothetical protein
MIIAPAVLRDIPPGWSRFCRLDQLGALIRTQVHLIAVPVQPTDRGARVPVRNLSNPVRRQATCALCGEVSVSEITDGWLIHTLVGNAGG